MFSLNEFDRCQDRCNQKFMKTVPSISLDTTFFLRFLLVSWKYRLINGIQYKKNWENFNLDVAYNGAKISHRSLMLKWLLNGLYFQIAGHMGA